jgi:hypothetical protein
LHHDAIGKMEHMPQLSNEKARVLIQNGMSWDEVIAIIGKPPGRGKGLINFMSATWDEGADYISVTFALPAADLDRPDEPSVVIGFGTVCDKTLHLATAWETVQWYAKKGAAKIGVKWD